MLNPNAEADYVKHFVIIDVNVFLINSKKTSNLGGLSGPCSLRRQGMQELILIQRIHSICKKINL